MGPIWKAMAPESSWREQARRSGYQGRPEGPWSPGSAPGYRDTEEAVERGDVLLAAPAHGYPISPAWTQPEQSRTPRRIVAGYRRVIRESVGG